MDRQRLIGGARIEHEPLERSTDREEELPVNARAAVRTSVGPEETGAAPILVIAAEPSVQRSISRAIARVDVRVSGDDLALLRALKAVAPDTAIVLIAGLGAGDVSARAKTAGAADVLSTPLTSTEVSRIVTAQLDRPTVRRWPRAPVLTESPRMEQILALARRVALADATVLIHGETGTGKELLARFVHEMSARASGPFVAVNCCALSETFVEAELFGHERGSFTGAIGRRAGLFETAAGGTLVLDEVGEIPLSVQAKLLRALQEREVHRVGSSVPVKVDVRVIAISNRGLRQEVQAGRFRQDLFYRLSVVNVTLPPLRERPADIPGLCRHFLQKYAAENLAPPESIGPEAMARLLAYSWPGNIRELENVIHSAVILATGPEIGAEHVVLPEETPFQTAPVAVGRTVTEVEKDLILSTLRRLNGNRTHAAKALGVSVRTIRNRLREYRLAAGPTC
jgi:DNA-binding NtrC family response regulator